MPNNQTSQGFGGEIALQDFPEIFNCLLTCYMLEACTVNGGDWTDTYLFKRKNFTNRKFFKPIAYSSTSSPWREVTNNENYENSYANEIESHYLKELNSRKFEKAICVTEDLKDWVNTPYANSCIDFVEMQTKSVIQGWNDQVSEYLFDMLNSGDLDVAGNKWSSTGTVKPKYDVFGGSALFGKYSRGPVGAAVSSTNLYVASTSNKPGYTFVPFNDSYGHAVTANPLASNNMLYMVDLEKAVMLHKENQAVDIFTGRTTSCGCKEFVLYKNCNDFLQQSMGYGAANGYPVGSGIGLNFQTSADITVRVVDSVWVNRRSAYLVSSNHEMVYGDVRDMKVKYKNASEYMPNERKDYIEFVIEVMFGVLTNAGLTKIVF